MPQAKGSRLRVILQEEAQFNVAPAPDATLLYVSGCGLKLSRPREESPILRGSREPVRSVRGNNDVSGPVGTVLQAYMAKLLKGLFGTVATTGAGPYTHTFKLGSSVPSFVIEKGFADIGQYFKYGGCKVSRMSMNVTPAGLQNLDFEFLGASEAVAQASFDTTATDLGYVPFDGFAVATIKEGGAAIADVVGIDGLTIDNDLDGEQFTVGGNGVRADIHEGTVKISGTLKARFTDVVLYNKALADTESSLEIKWQIGTGAGTAGNESLELTIPELLFAPNAPAVTGPRGILVELPFTAHYENAAQGSALQAVLKNSQATV